jgi:hypothetical protein
LIDPSKMYRFLPCVPISDKKKWVFGLDRLAKKNVDLFFLLIPLGSMMNSDPNVEAVDRHPNTCVWYAQKGGCCHEMLRAGVWPGSFCWLEAST